ncbi:MAG: ribonuclease III [Planctomycetota bacterium]
MDKNSEIDSAGMETIIGQCEKIFGYQFANKELLSTAITHPSFANTRLASYERMEFLGDSILGFVVCDYLYAHFPDWLEGDLTKIKSVVVSRKTCAQIGNQLGLKEYLIVGKGLVSQGEVPKSLLANAVEAIIAAIYLDGGMESAKSFLIPLIKEQVDKAVAGRLSINYKSELQQYSQKRFGLPPIYELVDHYGPDHDKSFQVRATVSRKTFAPAWGKNKKEAEQRAAANALADIEGKDPPFLEKLA